MRMSAFSILALVFCICSAGSLRAETVLNLNMPEHAAKPNAQNILDFAREVESKTGGAVKIKTGGAQAVEKSASAAGGPAEMAMIPLAQFTDRSLAASIFFQPFLFNFEAIIRAAAEPGNEIRRSADADVLKLSGARPLWWQPTGWNVIFSKGPISNPDDLQNHKVGVHDGMAAEFVKLCGGKPQLIPAGKQMEALNTDQVDASIASIAAIQGHELWNKTDTVTNVRYSENILVVTIDAAVWAKLTPDQQSIITAAARKAEKDIWDKHAAAQVNLYSYAEAKGMKITNISPEDTVAWRICSSSILENFMDRSGAAGAKLLAAYGKLRANPAVIAAKP
jgi:C4-dicarboxylate-binding protein DctP